MLPPILITHDFSFTGAPLMLLELAQVLAASGQDPRIAYMAVDGPMRPVFQSNGFSFTTEFPMGGNYFVLANTVIAAAHASQMAAHGVRVCGWLHETTDGLDHLRVAMPNIEDRLASLAFVILPSRFQMEQFRGWLVPGRFAQLRNIVRGGRFSPGAGDRTVAVVGPW